MRPKARMSGRRDGRSERVRELGDDRQRDSIHQNLRSQKWSARSRGGPGYNRGCGVVVTVANIEEQRG